MACCPGSVMPRQGLGRIQPSPSPHRMSIHPAFGKDKTLTEFSAIMANLNLPYPKFIEYAVPGNKQCGVYPADLPE